MVTILVLPPFRLASLDATTHLIRTMPCRPDNHNCVPPANPSCGDVGSNSPRTLLEIVRDYRRNRRPAAEREHRYWASHTTLTDAVRAAALSERADGKRHRHQCRIPGNALRRAADALVEPGLPKFRTFHDLHQEIHARIGGIHRIGELAVYDIACRIGAFLGLRPECVYLHAGTRKGARALDLRGASVPMRALPLALRSLTPSEVEDCLCIYKDSPALSVR